MQCFEFCLSRKRVFFSNKMKMVKKKQSTCPLKTTIIEMEENDIKSIMNIEIINIKK